MKIFILLSFLLMTMQSNAQLPSERPSDELVSTVAKQKLKDTNTKRVSKSALPSNAPLPEVAVAYRKTSALPQGSQMKQRRKSPSDASDEDIFKHLSKRKTN